MTRFMVQYSPKPTLIDEYLPESTFSEDVSPERVEESEEEPVIGIQVLLAKDDSQTTTLASVTAEKATTMSQSLKTSLMLAKGKAEELGLDQVAIDIQNWVNRHPWKAAFYAASAVGLFAPEILSIPALEALGFGVEGVRAGSIAARVQSVIGPIAARSVFAIWQSARMGGYGVENVNGGVRALINLADAAVAGCNPLKDCKGLIGGGGQRPLEGAFKTWAIAFGILVSLLYAFA
ncbi:MAG: hypothetical protein Q9167_005273 [Letrouitia subvulpina]